MKSSDVVSWARTLLKRPRESVVVDTETTGLEFEDEVVQIAVRRLDGVILCDSLVKPVRRTRIAREATAIHGIEMKNLFASPSYGKLKGLLDEALGGRRVLSYNAAFDYRMMMRAFSLDGGYRPVWRYWECVMERYALYSAWGGNSVHNRVFKKLNGPHTAVGDTLKVIELIYEMAGS